MSGGVNGDLPYMECYWMERAQEADKLLDVMRERLDQALSAERAIRAIAGALAQLVTPTA
jgi:hypothetical protein